MMNNGSYQLSPNDALLGCLWTVLMRARHESPVKRVKLAKVVLRLAGQKADGELEAIRERAQLIVNGQLQLL